MSAEEFRGVPYPVALRYEDGSRYERHWWRAGVASTVESLAPRDWTEEDRSAALVFITAKLLTSPVNPDDGELAIQEAALLAEDIVKTLMPRG